MKKGIKTLLYMCAIFVFMVGMSGCNMKEKIEQLRCNHEWSDFNVTKDATCTNVGEQVRTCTLCELTETEEIEKLAHVEVKIPAIQASCLRSGLTEGLKCGTCDEIIVEQKFVPAAGHKVVIDESVPATCLEKGKTEGSHCSVCEVVFVMQESVPALGHNVVEMGETAATCETDGYTGGSRCSGCGEVYTGEIVPALGHSWSDPVVTEATCSAEGLKVYTCTTCAGEKTETIEKVDHTYEFVANMTEPTCVSEGTAKYVCKVCDDTYTQALSALGHDYVNGICSRCDDNQYEVAGLTLSGVSLNLSGARPALTFGANISYALMQEFNSGVYEEFGFLEIEDIESFNRFFTSGKTEDYITQMDLQFVSYKKTAVSPAFDVSYTISDISAENVNTGYFVIPYVAYKNGDTVSYKYVPCPFTRGTWASYGVSVAYKAVEALNEIFLFGTVRSENDKIWLKQIVHESCALILEADYSETTHFFVSYKSNMGAWYDTHADMVIDSVLPNTTQGLSEYALYAVETTTGEFKKVTGGLRIPLLFIRGVGSGNVCFFVNEKTVMVDDETLVYTVGETSYTTGDITDAEGVTAPLVKTGEAQALKCDVIYGFTGIVDFGADLEDLEAFEYGSILALFVSE